MENFEKKFKELMKREGMEKLMEKPKEVYVVRFRPFDETEATITEEFDTKEERDDWYQSFGRWLEEEEGGKIEFTEEPAKE